MKALILLLTIIVLLPLSTRAGAAEKAADVVYLKGRAVIERQTKTVNAKLRAALLETDNIVTKDRSRAKMLFRDDSIVTLGSKSRLVIKQYLYNPESKRTESIYELADGKLKAVVAGGGFRVTTPTAFAAARGTVFVVWYDAATNTTGIGVIEGTVSFGNITEGAAGALVLPAGMMSTISGGNPPAPPQTFNPAAGPASGFVSELFETTGPEVELPPARLDQIRLDLLEQAGSTAAPPILQQPSTKTSVNIMVRFP